MAKMTANGAPATTRPGQERHDIFYNRRGGKAKRCCQYEYRDERGELFSYVKPTPEACRAARDAWLDAKAMTR